MEKQFFWCFRCQSEFSFTKDNENDEVFCVICGQICQEVESDKDHPRNFMNFH